MDRGERADVEETNNDPHGEDEHLEADYEDKQNGGIDEDLLTPLGGDRFEHKISHPDEEEEDEEEYDWEVEERKRDFLEFSKSHPDMAFTGSSVHDHIYNGGDLESASDDLPREEW